MHRQLLVSIINVYNDERMRVNRVASLKIDRDGWGAFIVLDNNLDVRISLN
jgi:hypothetical protein